MPPKIDPNEIRYSTQSIIQSTSRSSVENQAPLPPSPPNSVHSDSTPKKSVKISSRKEASGRVSASWSS